jgi:hypothetical protein
MASRVIPDLCNRLGMKCIAFQHSVEEIVFRIKRSINLYEDLGRPACWPSNKRDYIGDIFLDIFFSQIDSGSIESFDEFIREYYDIENPNDHIRSLVRDRMGIELENMDKYLVQLQERKIELLKEAIEAFRIVTDTYKNPIMYENDAKAMVVIEQQNRECINQGRVGRWYFVSADRHMLLAYLRKKESFKVKPIIYPGYFLEILRQCPEVGAEEASFGAILTSEVMLRGPGKDYTPLLAGLTRLGIKVLDYSKESLRDVIDILERADLTRWIIEIKYDKKLTEPYKEELRAAIAKMFDETASRNEVVRQILQQKGRK